METNSSRPTAKILAFPAGGRAGVAQRRTDLHPAANLSARPEESRAIVDGWYHEAAIREAEAAKSH